MKSLKLGTKIPIINTLKLPGSIGEMMLIGEDEKKLDLDQRRDFAFFDFFADKYKLCHDFHYLFDFYNMFLLSKKIKKSYSKKQFFLCFCTYSVSHGGIVFC